MNHRSKVFIVLFFGCTMTLGMLAVPARAQEYFFTLHVILPEPRVSYTEVLKENLAEIGIDLQLEVMEWGAVYDLLSSAEAPPFDEGGWDMAAYGLEVEPDPDFMSTRLASYAWPPEGETWTRWNNGKVDALFKEAGETTDFETKQEIYQELFSMFYDEVPFIPIYQREALMLFAPEVGDDGIEELAKWRPIVSDPPWDSQWISVEGTDTFVFAEYFWYPNLIPVWFNYLTGMFGTLVRADPDYEIVPDLAESWEISEDLQTYTFNLRSGVTWHDGEALTSEDVKFSIEVRMDPDLGSGMYSTLINYVDYIETPDNLTAIVHLTEPYGGFLYDMSRYANMEILPEHILGDVPPEDWRTSTWNTEQAPPGTGPWKFVEITEDYLKLERNEDYYFDPPLMEYIVYKRIPEKSAAFAALQAGEVHYVDFFYGFEPDFPEIQQMAADGEIKYATCVRLDIEGYVCNLEHPILGNKWVRKAISYAFPREDFIDDVMNGLGKPAKLMMPVDHWVEPTGLQIYEYDLDEARSALEKAGYKQEYIGEPVAWTFDPVWFAAGAVVGAAVIGIAAYLTRRK